MKTSATEIPASGHLTMSLRPGASILVIDPGADQNPIAGALRGASSQITCRSSVYNSVDVDADLIVANYDSMSPEECQALARSFGELKQKGRVIVFSNVKSNSEFAELFGTFGFTNVIAHTEELNPDQIVTTVSKILTRDIFGVDKYLVHPTKCVSLTVCSSRQKGDILELASQIALESGAKRRLAEAFQNVTDELLTNALYDAPVDAQGHHRFQHLSRRVTVDLAVGEEVTITFFYDDKSLGVAVRDDFGSISVDTILTYLSRCLRRGQDQINLSKGGAGIGLYQVFEALSQFVINLECKKRTEVIGIIDIRGTYRDFTRSGKSFNLFVNS